MGRKKQASFKMKGHTLPGINQKSETANIKDGRSPSSAFQMQQPGDSPLQAGFWGKAANALTGGGFGAIKKGMQGDWKGAGKSLLGGGVLGVAGKALGVGGGGDAGGGAGAQIKEEAKAELKEEIAQG
jgi:hypothetical protein